MEKKAIKKHDCDHFCTLSLQGAACARVENVQVEARKHPGFA